jgi:hypothetical protein
MTDLNLVTKEELQRLGAVLADAQTNAVESPFAIAAVGLVGNAEPTGNRHRVCQPTLTQKSNKWSPSPGRPCSNPLALLSVGRQHLSDRMS